MSATWAPGAAPLPALPDRPPAAVLLDRDGTLLTETAYLVDPGKLELLPGAAEAVARLNRAGVSVAVVTNQSAIARGWLTEQVLAEIHAAMAERLAAAGARVDLVLHCGEHPDFPDAGDPRGRRKPDPGMLVEAAERLGVPLEHCVTVGDSHRDLEAGRRCGVPGILVATGKGEDERAVEVEATGREPLFVPDLAAAVDLLLGR